MSELFQLPAGDEILMAAMRLGVAAALGGLLGAERQWAGKAAGLRTHMLVSVASALFVLFPQHTGMSSPDLSRVIQGVATGIGFLGAGTILKRSQSASQSEEVHGLTTAASIWLTAAIGLAAGYGPLWLPVMGAVLAWIILHVFSRFERVFPDREPDR